MGRRNKTSTMGLKTNIAIILTFMFIGFAMADTEFFTNTNHNNNTIFNVSNITSGFYCNATTCYTIEQLSTDTTYSAGSNLTLTSTIFSLDTIGVLNWLDGIYLKIINAFSGVYSDLTGKPTLLSNFTDDLGDRGYTSLNNFTNDPGYITSYTETDPLWTANQSSYSTTAEILAFGYYNATDFVITDYFTKSEIIGFNYYNSSDFIISDYFTSVEVLAFNYYNSSDFVISNYFTRAEVLGFNYYNSTDFVISDYYTKSQIESFGYYNLTDFDISNYYTSTQTDTEISNANTSMKNYADDTFITQANEGNLDVNSSDYWDNLGTPSDISTGDLTDDGTFYLKSNPFTYWNDTYATFNQTFADERYLTSQLSLFFYNDSDPVNSSYTIMNTTINPNLQIDTFSSLGDGDNFLTKRILSSLELSILQTGAYNQHTTINYTAGTKDAQLRSTIHVLLANGTEIQIGSSPLSPVLTTDAYQQIIWSGVIETETVLETGDNLTMYLYAAVSGSGTAPTLDLVVGGDTSARLDIGINPVDISVTETDPLSIHKTGDVELTANWGQGAFNFTNTLSWFLGKVDWSTIQNKFLGSTTDDLTEGSTNLYDNQSWNESHANTIYADISIDGTVTSVATDDTYLTGGAITTTGTITFNTTLAETDLSVNSSDYWDALGTINSTQMENSAGELNIKESWLTTFWNAVFGTKDTDDLTEGSTNLYDNQSWNESHANTLYATIGAGGTVTSVATDDTYLTGGEITTTGTITFNTTLAGTSLAVNSSDYWDSLGSPSDINAADITDDGTYRVDSWDNFTGIPTATPANGVTTSLSTANQIFDWAVGLFLQSIVTDTSPQLGGYLDTNGENIGSTTDEIENIYVGDTTRIYFGNSQDASIYFNGTNLIISG